MICRKTLYQTSLARIERSWVVEQTFFVETYAVSDLIEAETRALRRVDCGLGVKDQRPSRRLRFHARGLRT